MFTQLLDLLMYSALTASLVAQTMIMPDAAFVLTPNATENFTQETVELTLTLKTNTPITTVHGLATYNPSVLTLMSSEATTDFYTTPDATDTPGIVPFTAHTDKDTTGIHPAFVFTFLTTNKGTTTVQLSALEARTPDGKVINPLHETSANVQVIERRNSLDLNADNKQSFADFSVFIAHLATQNPSADFNNDSRVTGKDFRILLRAY